MDFGKVAADALGKVDFRLPPEPEENKVILAGHHAAAQNAPPIGPHGGPGRARVYLGCTSWGRKEWVGKIFPPGTKESAFLEHYVKHYNAVELNATHYKIYSPADIRRWADKSKGRPFRYCPKIPQRISHYSGFENVDDLTHTFLEGVSAFGDQLGPIFLQVSEQYAPTSKNALFNYLRSLPTDLPFFLEVRHATWFSDPSQRRDLFHCLRDLNIGAVITDTAGRRDCTHMQLTVPKTFIRFVANSLHPTDFTRLDAWVERIRYWLDQGLEELYIFLHMPDETAVPELSLYLVDKLNAVCGLELPRPKFVEDGRQTSLF